MKVLVACEESQEVCKAFRERGHEAYSCDIQECSGGHPEWHIKGDALALINGNCSFTTEGGMQVSIDGTWDLLIAHPPCTYLSNAGAARLYKNVHDGDFQMINVERLKKGILGRDFFMRFLYADCPKIAIENPVPSGIYVMPQASQTIQPYEHGHPYSKKTLLWLKGLPPLMATEVIDGYKPFLPSGTGRKLGGDSYGAKGCAHDGKPRSKTFPGIAKAMADQWGSIGEEGETHDT